MSSKRVYAICGAREMQGLYLAYHSLDPAQCVERILESKVGALDESDNEQLMRRALEALRVIRRG